MIIIVNRFVYLLTSEQENHLKRVHKRIETAHTPNAGQNDKINEFQTEENTTLKSNPIHFDFNLKFERNASRWKNREKKRQTIE